VEKFRVTLTGKMPLLLHADNIEWADMLEAWKKDPNMRVRSRAGDDRTPAWRWIGSAYTDGKQLVIPSDNLMVAFREGGALVNTGKGKKTYKAQTQSGAMVVEPSWPILVGGKSIPYAPIKALMEEEDFNVHQQRANELGFVLSIKRAKIGFSKHIRVRPRIDTPWSISGTIQVWDDTLTEDVLRVVWTQAGLYKGLCDWRPGSKTPGQYGTFEAEIARIKG